MSRPELEAVVACKPEMRTVFNRKTLTHDPHLAYDALVLYKKKPKECRLILCSSLDQVQEGDLVHIVWHSGLSCYQHSRSISLSNENNCTTDFYYITGEKA